MEVVSVATAKIIDKCAINEFQIPSIVLMEAAAHEIFTNIKHMRGNFHIFCGEGNNGGDGLAVARKLLADNKNVKIEEAKDTGTSLYIAVTNKISIADMKNNYARIQTIAHECIHSCQDRRLLLFNFIFSNINIIYFIIISVLTILKVITNQSLQIAILMLLTII